MGAQGAQGVKGDMGPPGLPGESFPPELVERVSEAIDRINMELRKLEPPPQHLRNAIDELHKILAELMDE